MNEETRVRKEELEKEILTIQNKLNNRGISDEEKKSALEELERLSKEHNELLAPPVIDEHENKIDIFLKVEMVNNQLNEINKHLETIKNSGDNNINKHLAELRELSEAANDLLSIINNTIVRDEDVEAAMELTNRVNNLINEIDEIIKKNVTEKVSKYVSALERTERHMRYIISNMNNDLTVLHDISDEVSELVSEYENIRKEYDEIAELINNEITNPYVASPNELNNRLKRIRDGIKIIKNRQINNYNRMVTVLNNRLDTLARELEHLSEELRIRFTRMLSLNRLELCTYEVTRYNDREYLNHLNYEKLKEQLMLSAEIEQMLNNPLTIEKNLAEQRGDENDNGDEDNSGNNGASAEDENIDRTPSGSSGGDNGEVPPVDPVEAFDAELKNIEDEMVKLYSSYKDDMTAEEMNKFYEEINNVENLLDILKLNLVDAEDNIKNNEKFIERVRKCEETLNILKQKLNQLFAARMQENAPENEIYLNCMRTFAMLRDKIENVVNMLIDPAFEDKNVSQNAISAFMNNLNKLEQEVNQFEQMVEANKTTFNEEQYKNLTDSIAELKELIKNGRDNVNAFTTLRQNGFLDLLNGDISDLEQALNSFNNAIEDASLDNGQQIKINKANRKILDNMYKKIVDEIARIEANLEKYKDKDPSKYEEEKERLNGCKDRLAELEKKYHSRCGFLVRTWRSAKKFYKKHKKAVLIGAGLAAIVLLAQPVIIPALMEGNVLLANTIPFLSAPLNAINNVLGNAINASIVRTSVNGIGTHAWRFANGLMLTPTLTSTSLLKGLAMSAANSALLSAPLIGGVVMALKALNKKRQQKEATKSKTESKTSEKKATMKEKTEKLKQKGKELVASLNKGSSEKKEKMPRSVKNGLRELRNLSAEDLKLLFDSLSVEEKQKLIAAIQASTEEQNKSEDEELEENKKGIKR